MIEGVGRHYLTMNLEKIEEKSHKPIRPVGATDLLTPDRNVHSGGMPGIRSRGRTESQSMRAGSMISSPFRTQRTFASIERLKAFKHAERNRHANQPYG